MAFIVESGNVISFAEYDDVFKRDQRVFDNNESLSDDVVEGLLIRATERIISKLRASDWWVEYYVKQNVGGSYTSRADIPSPDINRIIARQNDFTDLCVYEAMAEYILPLIADFSAADSAEMMKLGFYKEKASSLFAELITAGDWYDFDDDSTVESSEKAPGAVNLKRVR